MASGGIQVKRATIINAALGTSSSKALSSPGRTLVNAVQVQDPATLARLLQQVQDQSDASASAASSNPHSAPCIVRKVSCANGATIIVRHSLARALTGWWICRATGAFLTAIREILPTEGAYPSGVDLATALVVLVTTTGSPAILDFCITAD